jgi:hypothetical protein
MEKKKRRVKGSLAFRLRKQHDRAAQMAGRLKHLIKDHGVAVSAGQLLVRSQTKAIRPGQARSIPTLTRLELRVNDMCKVSSDAAQALGEGPAKKGRRASHVGMLGDPLSSALRKPAGGLRRLQTQAVRQRGSEIGELYGTNLL